MVLDPLSALSLAGTVVQFIDFGSKLLSESCDIYRSATGTSPGNHDLEITTEGDEAPEEDALVGLARACKEVADDLLSTVQQLKVEHGPHRKWRSFLQALKNIRGKEKVHSLRQRMDSLRMQLVLQLVTILRYGSNGPLPQF
ncbi:hypothetical protein AOQ84DRAFT_325285 [Glonium stellatum]|uniref:Fungal N-terminal domain-containing protein n=1 Tax=Glonium stellatum TaxID=574774 RepID=A0A8E2ESJ1_9PEZI|nr:hypothetical protein AOQ84DRAFT_325285 [Glonium stellatum]